MEMPRLNILLPSSLLIVLRARRKTLIDMVESLPCVTSTGKILEKARFAVAYHSHIGITVGIMSMLKAKAGGSLEEFDRENSLNHGSGENLSNLTKQINNS